MWSNSAGALASVLLVTVTGVSTAALADESMDRIREKGALRVAVYKDFPPYSHRNGGRYVGIDVDIARALAERMGLALDLMPVAADESVGDDLRNWVWKGHYLGGGTADVMMHVPVDPAFARENDQATLFAPYLREQMALLYNQHLLADDTSPQTLARHRVGVEVDSVADYYLSGAFSGLMRQAARHYPNNWAAFEALGRAELEAVLAPRAQAEAFLKDQPEGQLRLSLYSLRGMLRSYWDVGLAVRADAHALRAELERAMSSLHDGGRLKQLFELNGVSYVVPPHALTQAVGAKDPDSLTVADDEPTTKP